MDLLCFTVESGSRVTIQAKDHGQSEGQWRIGPCLSRVSTGAKETELCSEAETAAQILRTLEADIKWASDLLREAQQKELAGQRFLAQAVREGRKFGY